MGNTGQKPVNHRRRFIGIYVTVLCLILVSSFVGIWLQGRPEPGIAQAPVIVEQTDEDKILMAPDSGAGTLTRQETYGAAIAPEVRYCSDPSLPAGTEAVLSEGEAGQMRVTADITYSGGAEEKRTVLEETVVKAPKQRIIGVGTGEEPAKTDPEDAPIIGDGYIQLATGEVLTYTKTDTVRATAYTHTDAGCDYFTATQTPVRKGTVAVDPRYIPYGTRMFLTSSDGSYVYGIAVAEDCGGDIKGDRMDLYFPTYEECREFGRKVCTIYYLG